VRQGKVFDIEVEGVTDREKVTTLLQQAADRLLANTVIENYQVDVIG
jgi:phosphoribosylformylglycinamidine synthase